MLHRAGHAGQRHEIAHLHGAFQQQENAGDEVLHQLLRTEADGHADNPRAGQQRADIHADLSSVVSPATISTVTSRPVRRIGRMVRIRAARPSCASRVR